MFCDMRILSVFGTRPEAIKMAPLVRALRIEPDVASIVCVTGQHRQMLDQVLQSFEIQPDYDLNLMVTNQGLNDLAARMIAAIDSIYDQVRPDRVLVHGDTTTAMSAALAAFHRRIPVGHVEAGLRTYDPTKPWPEEMNRRVIDIVSDWLFAPTVESKANLLGESLGGRIIVTGNTVIDALMATVSRMDVDGKLLAELEAEFSLLNPMRRLLLVTGHRRENHGAGIVGICAALRALSERPDIEIVYPVHLNPNVRGVVQEQLAGLPNVHLIEPLSYIPFVYLMRRAYMIMTDSGGVQEEAPALGKPVLVTRDVTERPEAVNAGTVQLVGTDKDRIVASVNALYDSSSLYSSFARKLNPYGDGCACERIVSALMGRSFDEFTGAATQAMAA